MADEGGGGSSVLTIVGVVLVTLTLVGGCGLFCVIGGVVAGGVGAFGLMVPAGPNVPPPSIQVPSAPSAPASPVATPTNPTLDGARRADIANLEPDRWHEVIDQPPMPFQRFDALKSFAWALALAKAWRPDAELKLIFINHVKADGTMDLIADDEADGDYRFYSPSLVRLAEQAEAVTDEKIWSGFRVWVHEGKVDVLITDSTFTNPPMKNGEIDPDYSPIASVSCDQAKLIRTVRADTSVPKRPFYEISLRWWNRKGWRLTTDPGDAYHSVSDCSAQ